MHIFRNGNPESLQLNAQIGMVVRDWEAAICDLRDMSGITIAIVDEALRGAPDQEEHLSIPPPDSVRHILFCAYGLQKMINELHDRYYEAIEAD